MSIEVDPISVSAEKFFGRCDGPTLSEYVRTELEDYFQKINGYPANDLYAFVISEVEKPLIETVLNHAGRNQTKAANMLGISRSTLRKKISQYGLE